MFDFLQYGRRIFLVSSATKNLPDKRSAYKEIAVLEPEAFKVAFIKNEESLNIKVELGKDIYLYDDKLQINITKPKS